MRRSASFGDIIVEVIEKYEDELMALDPEYIDGGDDYANRKQEALFGGQIDTALLFTRDRRVKEVLLTIQSDLNRIANGEISLRRSASDTIRNLEARIARLEGRTNKRAKVASRSLQSKVDALRSAFEDCAKELHQMFDEFDGNPTVQDNDDLEWMSGDLYSHLQSISDVHGELNFDVRSLFSRLENLVDEVETAKDLHRKMKKLIKYH